MRSFGLHDGLRIETLLDPKRQPYLDHHRIDGTPVLPGVMGIESFAEAAALILPGWQVLEVDGIDFHAPFKFYRDEPRAITVTAVLRPAGDTIVADCRLTGERSLPGQAEPQVTLHFTARVCLAREAPREDVLGTCPGAAERELGPDEIYRIYFHGPAYRVVEKAWRSNGEAVGLFSDLPAPRPRSLRGGDTRRSAAHRALLPDRGAAGDGHARHDGPAAPRGARASPARAHGEGPALRARPARRMRGFEARVVDAEGHVYLALEGYRTVELPAAVDEKGLASFRAVMSRGADDSKH